MKKIIFLFLMLLVFNCASSPSVVVPVDKKLIDEISSDPTIPQEQKIKIITKLVKVNVEASTQLGEKNVELQKEILDMKAAAQKDAWKIETMNMVVRFFWLAIVMIVLYILFKARKLLGSPI